MTREEQIEEAARENTFIGSSEEPSYHFIKGAEWADKNPEYIEYIKTVKQKWKDYDLYMHRLEAMLGVAEKLYLSAENHYDSCGEAPEDCFLCKNVEKYRAEIEKLKGDGK